MKAGILWCLLGFSQLSLAGNCHVILNTVFNLTRSVSNYDKLRDLERDIDTLWPDMFSPDMRTTTSIRVRFRNAARKFAALKGGSIYRGMWVTADELVQISKDGLDTKKGNYGDYIHFSSNPSEAIRFGAQVPKKVSAQKPKGILVLISANPKKGTIKHRQRNDGESDGLTEHQTAEKFVPADAINGMWVFDPDGSDSTPMRPIKFRSLRD